MDTLIVTPKNKKQLSLLKALLKEMEINFKVKSVDSEKIKMTKEEFFERIDCSMEEVKKGNYVTISDSEELKDLLDSL